MRSSVLPLVEPDGPVINPLAACLKLEVLKIVWVFPDDVFFGDGTTVLIADHTECLGARVGWGMQGQVQCGIPIAPHCGKVRGCFPGGFSFWRRCDQGVIMQLSSTKKNQDRAFARIGRGATLCFLTPRELRPLEHTDDDQFRATRRGETSQAMAPRCLRSVRPQRSA